MRLWKLLGLAGVIGIGITTAVGVAVVTKRRHWRHYDADELRSELRQRLAEAERRADSHQQND